MRDPYFVPAGTPLLAQLQNFQEEEERLGLVVDEYGELMGLITLEDMLEEIIGEFTTHSPLQAGAVTRRRTAACWPRASDRCGSSTASSARHFPLDGPKTLNGLILEHLEDIPEPGTTVKIADYPIEIVQTQDRAVKLCPHLSPNSVQLINYSRFTIQPLPAISLSEFGGSVVKWLLHRLNFNCPVSVGRWSRKDCSPNVKPSSCRSKPMRLQSRSSNN